MHRDKVYIVGFSEAKARCSCEMTWDRVRLCPELKWVEQQLGNGETNVVLEEIGVPPRVERVFSRGHQGGRGEVWGTCSQVRGLADLLYA